MRHFMISALLLTAGLTAAHAQVVEGVTESNATGDTTTVFTIAPTTGISASDYVKLSADAINYQIAAANLVITRAQRDDVKAFARQMLDHATSQQKSLHAALVNADRKITRPPTTLSSLRQADIDLLRKAPRSGVDNLYLTQQIDAAPSMWALQKGYASDGTDPALRQVAQSAVAPFEQDYRLATSLTPTGITNAR